MSAQDKRKKKSARKQQFLKDLTRAGIAYHVEPKCAWHYYIDVPIHQGIHFWPTGIGRWYNTKTGDKGIGIATLISEVKFAKEDMVSKKPHAKPSLKRQLSKVSTDAKHRQRKIMDHFGMNFS